MESLVEVRDLVRKFGKTVVLNGLNFSIYKGEIFGLLGPNAAGKSTFISILTGLCKPTSGDVLIQNISISRQREKMNRRLGYVPQDIALYPMLSGYDNLSLWAGIYGLTGQVKRERIGEVLDVVRLRDRAKDRVDQYSGGMKRRLNIAVALLSHPEILVMDEPTVGVDIQSRKYILDAVRNLKKEGRTVIFTSHYMDEMETLCDRIAILDQGQIKALGTVEELLKAYGRENIGEIMLELADDM